MTSRRRLAERRSSNYLLDDANLSECYCCYDTPDQIHHVSYVPEETVPVCTSCHAEIHADSKRWEQLQPDQPRPENYETVRRRQVEDWDAASSIHATCVDCGETFSWGDLYSVDIHPNTVQRAVGDEDITQLETRYRCHGCEGSP